MFLSHPGLRAIAAYYFFYYGFLGVFSPFWGPYLRSLNTPMALIGLMISLPQINRTYAPAIWGWCADRFGHRRAMLQLGGLGALGGFVVLMFTRSIMAMFWTIFVASFFWSAILPQVEATTMGLLKGDSGQYARLRIWGSLGFMVATLVGGYLIDHLGVAVMPRMVVVIMIGVVCFLWMVPESSGPVRQKSAKGGLKAILARREVQVILAACFLTGASHGLLISFYSIHLEDHHVAKSLMGWLWSIGILAEIVLFWYMTQLSQRFSLRNLYLLAMATAVVRYLLIAWLADSIPVLMIAQLMHALTFAVFHAVSIAYIHRHFGAEHQTQGQAIYIVVSFGAGGSVGSMLTGFLWNRLGGEILFTAAALVSGMALLIAWRGLSKHAIAAVAD